MDNTQKFALIFVILIYVPAFLVSITLLLIAVKLGILDETNAMIDFAIFLIICAITLPFVFRRIRKGIAEGGARAKGAKTPKNRKKP